ncbi:ribonuclease E inhibitor RraB [Dyella sp. 2HG41-7]|uniref:ribonuclease E inhibitor RraB n=1 Tax=Dyella sp. 2HG41-7 TaxID=2883239 RepID=UPI001F200FCE|nr:ribonuclease E inhibitor RraB [Dyella sp. 2HG41-7]
MSIVESLMSGAKADASVLDALNSHGDDFSIARDVDFVFLAKNLKKAEEFQQFINNNHYGVARLDSSDVDFRVLVKINMSINQPVILSISAFMVCLGILFDVEYDGWGCPVNRPGKTQ